MRWKAALEGGSRLPLMWSATFSPIMMHGALVFPLVIRGMIEASATRKPSTPCTLPSGSITAISSTPIRQVPDAWKFVVAVSLTNASISSSGATSSPGSSSLPR